MAEASWLLASRNFAAQTGRQAGSCPHVDHQAGRGEVTRGTAIQQAVAAARPDRRQPETASVRGRVPAR